MKKVLLVWKKINNSFCNIFFCKINLKRDLIVISIAILISTILIVFAKQNSKIKQYESELNRYLPGESLLLEEEIYQEVKAIQEKIDKSDWKTHQSKWYGFEIKYPNSWNSPKSFTAKSDSNWEYRFEFRKKINNENDTNPYVGFDAIVYNLEKVKELKKTDEFPKIKDTENHACETITGHIIETGNYPAEEIYIPPADNCYNTDLFFSFTRGSYIYNITPVLRENFSKTGDPRIEISDNFPEFFVIASTLNPIEIIRPKPAPPKPKITAPYPVSYKKINGKLVCAKKNDKPSKSKKNKKKHLDMECCLDPDEYPNPHCHYDPAKYGKYLNKNPN